MRKPHQRSIMHFKAPEGVGRTEMRRLNLRLLAIAPLSYFMPPNYPRSDANGHWKAKIDSENKDLVLEILSDYGLETVGEEAPEHYPGQSYD